MLINMPTRILLMYYDSIPLLKSWESSMGVRGELYTQQVKVENRTYFFNVKENRLGDVCLQIVESKNTDGAGFDRHAIVVFQDEMQTFLQGLNESLEFIEKKRKEQLKEKREKKQRTISAETVGVEKKKIINKRHTSTKPARKVRIVKKGAEE